MLIIAGLLYFVGELLSNSLTNLCNMFGLPELVLGILLGFITSIPELITFIEAQRKEKKKNTGNGKQNWCNRGYKQSINIKFTKLICDTVNWNYYLYNY